MFAGCRADDRTLDGRRKSKGGEKEQEKVLERLVWTELQLGCAQG